MNLLPNWQAVLRKAWSIRLLILAGLLSAAEVILPLFMHNFPHRVFSALIGLVVIAATIARLLAQKEVLK